MDKNNRLLEFYNMASDYPTIHTKLLEDPASETVYKVMRDYPIRVKLLNYFRADKNYWSSRGRIVQDPLNTLYFVIDGDGYLQYDDKSILLKKGFVYLIPTNRTRIYGCKNFIEKHWCFFQMRNNLGIDLLDGYPEIVCLGDFMRDKNFQNLFVNTNYKKLLKLYNFIYEILNKTKILDRCLEKNDAVETKYNKLFQTIESDLSAKTTISHLSEVMNMTAEGFSRAFHRDRGQTIKSYINQRLNQKACDLILLTDLKIKDIAHELQYKDEYYFIRFFKKMNGIPPQQYRNRVRQ